MNKTGIFRVIGLLGPLVVVSILASNVWAVLNLSLIPSGTLSAVNLLALRELLGGTLSMEAIRPSILLTAFLQNVGFDQLTSLKLGTTIFFAVLGLAVALTAFIITNNRIAAIFSGFVAGLFPVFFQPIFAGDYGLVSAIALTQLSLVFVLKFIHDGGRWWFGAGILSLIFSSLSDPTAPIFTSFVLAAWFLYAVYRRTPRNNGLLALLAVSIGLTVVLLPFNLESLAAASRGTLWVPKIFADSPVLILLGLSSIAGGIALFLRDKWKASAPLLWALIPIGLAVSIRLDFLLYAIPILIVLSSTSLTHLSDFFRVTKEKGSKDQDQGKEDSIVFEFKLEKLLAILLVALLAVSSLALLPSMERIQEENALSNEEVGIISSADSFSGIIGESDLLLAPGRISPWLRALSGLNTITALSEGDSDRADAAISTAFRIRSEYLMIDEWQPFSSNRSPFISSFDGQVYTEILHLDDRITEISLKKFGQKRTENFHGLGFKGYQWEEDFKEIRLSLSFENREFSVDKTITLDKKNPIVEISYHVMGGEGIELVDLSLPLFIEDKFDIQEKITGDSIELLIRRVNIFIDYESPTSLEFVRITESSARDHVLVTFTQTAGSIDASFKINVPTASSSGQESFYTSFFDINDIDKVDYILTPTNPPDLNLYQYLLPPLPILEIDDAFSRVSLNLGSDSFVEAPYRAEVIREVSHGHNLTTTYKTAGLIIEKKAEFVSNALSLTYDIEAWKSDIELESMSMVFWIPWGTTIRDYQVEDDMLTLLFGPGINSVKLSIKSLGGDFTVLDVGPHPEFLKQHIKLEFMLNPDHGQVKLDLAFEGKIEVEYFQTTRPNMAGSDKQLILSSHTFLEEEFSGKEYTLYRVRQ